MPASTIGSGFTVTVMASVFTQPFASVTVTVKVYVPSVAGSNTGFAAVGSLKPVVGIHEYVNGPFPVATVAPPSVPVASTQIAKSAPASTVGNGLTKISTTSSSVHPFASVTVTVKLYVAGPTGVNVGLAAVVELNPKAGLQEYV